METFLPENNPFSYLRHPMGTVAWEHVALGPSPVTPPQTPIFCASSQHLLFDKARPGLEQLGHGRSPPSTLPAHRTPAYPRCGGAQRQWRRSASGKGSGVTHSQNAYLLQCKSLNFVGSCTRNCSAAARRKKRRWCSPPSPSAGLDLTDL